MLDFYVWRGIVGVLWVETDRCRLTRSRRNSSLQHKMDSHWVPAEEADWTAGQGAGGGFNSPACMFMSNVLSPMGWIDHRCHIWQWLTAPVIAMLALGDEQTTTVGACGWSTLAFLSHLQVQLWILHHGAQWSRSAWTPECCELFD